MKRLERYVRPYVLFIILTMVLKLIAALMGLFTPYLMEIILDKVVPAGDVPGIYFYGGGMILCALLGSGLDILSNQMSAYSAGKITKAIRHDLFQKLESLSAKQMDELTTSSAVSRLTSDTYNVNQVLARFQRVGVRAPIMLIGGISLMLSMDATLALVLLCLLPVIALVVYFVTKNSIPVYTRQQTVLDDVVLTVQENITGIRVIKALSKTEYEKGRFNAVNQELSKTTEKAGAISAITNPAATLTLSLGLTLTVLVGAYRVNAGACESGVLVAFLQYFAQIIGAMLGITRIFVMCSKGIASANRVAEVMDRPEDLIVTEDLYHPDDEDRLIPHIEFRDVSFSYTGNGPVLEHLSFQLQKGQTLGILGATGAGKSTLISLLLRLYDPDEGRIFIDGRDIRSIPAEELRDKFGTVFQNDFVTEGTVADNIRFFRSLDSCQLTQAAQDAQAAAFIAEKEDGMNSEVVVRGNNLSGGQKQRLLIARALASNPEILILDDASSALDYQTDAELRHALRRHYRGTTTVLVAQRVSSLRHADLILVLDDGKVIGQGDHNTLMKTCDEYRQIAAVQMGSGKEAI